MRDAPRVLLLGCGMQGRAVVHDLLGDDFAGHLTVADADPTALQALAALAAHTDTRLTRQPLDAGDAGAVRALMRACDIVVEALPGPFALAMGQLAAECGVPCVSSMYYVPPGEDDPARLDAARAAVRRLDALAREKGITLLTEFGLDPGLDLVLGARALAEAGDVEEFRAYGAGIPAPGARNNPLQYKFSWSPIGVMRSYHRPARLISAGREVLIAPDRIFKPQHVHRLEVTALGSPLECFPNGDAVHYAGLFGIRDRVREMGRYTGRLPGHCAFWDVMVKCGFLDEHPLAIGGAAVAPMEFTARLLAGQKQFQYMPDEADLTFVRVDARGRRDGRGVRVVYDLIDRRDPATGLTSMQRTVGFTLALGARLILSGELSRAGVLTPLDVPYEAVFPRLERHGIRVTRREEAWS